MPAIDDIFSLRIVTVDFYMEKPKAGLDPCFSEFRAKEIKKVPIIRIFGSSKEGQKTCMHVHGIFPYLYIPYDKKDFESIDKAVYSVASSIDKALNISLGQGSSSSIHVFKVQLVKGIPFYGYHKKEHQYLKIYMLNPRFIRRTANLLQNGAIMGKIFQPHESHVPYILQFFIDYNLYGMSLLHVPKDILKFRRKNETDVIPYAVKKEQILDYNIAEKQSVSQLEMDIASGFILNRFQLVTKTSSHTNPGIESIWHDERVRREKLAKDCDEVPPLEIPVSQERPHVQPTESEQFYRAGLVSKLQQLEASMNDTINTTVQTSMAIPEKSVKEKKRTFNLQKLIANSVYPDECAPDDILTNASCIEDHLLNRSIFHASMKFSETPTSSNPDQEFLDDTLVDEELVLSLTQPDVKNQTLREEDMELLDVMQQLEDRDGENDIDLDSTLAPLSQNLDLNTSEAGLDSALLCDALAVDSGKDVSDNEDINDFSMALDDMDELLLKLSQNSQPSEPAPPMAQIDGADDIMMTPKKNNKQQRLPTTPKTPVTPKRSTTVGGGSPRTPKSVAKKYAPLPLIIQSRSLKKNPLASNGKQMSPIIGNLAKSENVVGISEECERGGSYSPPAKSLQSLRKKLALTELRRKSVSTDSESHAANANFTNSKRKKMIDLNKTHITCSLRTPRRRGERRLKVYESTDIPETDSPKTPLKANSSNDVQKQPTTMTYPTKSELNGTYNNVSSAQENSTRNYNTPRVRLSKSPLINKMIAKQQNETESKVPKKTRRLSLRSHKKIQERKSKRIQSKSLAEENGDEKGEENGEEKGEEDGEENGEEKGNENPYSIHQKVHEKCAKIEEKQKFGRKLIIRLKRHKLPKTEKPLDSPKTPVRDSVGGSKPRIVVQPDKCADSDHKSGSGSSSKKKKIRVELKKLKIKNEGNTPERKPLDSPKTPIFTKSPECKSQNRRYSTHVDKFRLANLTTPRTPRRTDDNHDMDVDDDHLVHSFYESSFIVDSPVFSDMSVPSPVTNAQVDQELSPSADRAVIISADLPRETREEIRQNCKLYNIPEVVNQQPFYGNYADVTHKKEVGHTVLSIPGNTLSDLEEFKSSIANLQGLSCWRRKCVQALGIPFRNEDQIREYFASEKPVVITPSVLPPTKRDAKVWLKARQILKEKRLEEKANVDIEEDSPIKIRRQKVVMLMENESGGSGDDMDCSMCSLSLTPLTPANVTRTDELKTKDSLDHTPLTGQSSSKKSGKIGRSLKARVSLSQKLKDICISNAMEKGGGDDVLPKVSCASKDHHLEIGDGDGVSASQASLQSNESGTSELALAELERSSFVRNLQSSQGSLETSFGLSMATLNNTFGFKVNLENLQQAKSDVEHNNLTTLSLELFVPTREDLLPNPQFDSIQCLFYAIDNSIPSSEGQQKTSGFIIVAGDASTTKFKCSGMDSNVEIKVVASELEGLCKFLELCGLWDPDIFVGYEIEMSSWGYVMERAKHLDLNIGPLLSRVPSQKMRDFIDEDKDQFTDLDVETKLCGRILLDVWRLMRSEIALTSYTFENVMYHIMHRRCPRHTHKDLTQWFAAPQTRWIVLEYYMERVNGTLELLDQLDLIGRTSEMAKLIGIQFYEVLSRGSQFRVESMMLRIAKPKNLVPLSPSVQQRAHMRAPEYLPLILEPQSRFYPDPVIVLDFQSLYPSMIMAYNYCFSTCLGRVEHLGSSTPFEFGASQLRVSPTLLRKLLEHDLVTISPCGVVYVKREVREGILPRMLSEVLDTRQMVKQSMKLHKSSSALQRILHSRQLGLKLMANVTYGYTAANFSGRMPCVEVGDSVVAKGRETLERAIKLVEANETWNVKVVYGDTDSLFVLVPGRNRAEAFRIGAEIAEIVTQDNPQPVKLKLEKVYQPCILQTKKRYVGYMYETPDQEAPVYEAKGIETVRRDGCPAAAKMLEKCLKILFDSADVSQVKSYVCRQFTKLLSGKANIQDLIFAKEFRGLNGYKPTACVPALELTRKWIQTDPRRIPRRGERVPFIITNGPPGVPLIKLVRTPHDVLADEGLKINAIYYITKAIIPPLNRCFLLIGADVNDWFTNLPRKILFTPALSTANEIISTTTSKKSTISQYFSSTNCIIDCGRQTKQGICSNCSLDMSRSLTTLQLKISKLERGYHLTKMICQACCGRSNLTHCSSLDCPVLYVLEVKRRDLSQISHIENLIEEHFSDKKCVSI